MNHMSLSEEPISTKNFLIRYRGRLANLLLVFIGFLIAALIGEFVARRFVTIQGQLFTYSPHTGYALRPNRSFQVMSPEFTVRYETNSLGLRGPEVDFGNTNCMVLGLGDSFTFGVGVEYEETYLEAMRRALMDTAQIELQVVNSGHGGWGTAQEAVFLEEYYETFHPRLITVAVFPNDVTDNTSPNLFEIASDGTLERTGTVPRGQTEQFRDVADSIPLYGWLTENSALFNVIRGLIFDLTRSGNQSASEAGIDLPNDEALYQAVDQHLVDLENRILSRIHTIAAAGGAEVVFAFMPLKQEDDTVFIYNDGYNYCQANGMYCIDMGEVFNNASTPIESLYYEQDGHWRPAGHVVAGNALADYVQRHHLLQCHEVTSAASGRQ
jgi:hypothetical protein